MMNWSTTTHPVLSAHGVRHQITEGPSTLTFDAALERLERSPAFRCFLSELIVASDYAALRWETPPVTKASIGKPFEFVLVNDPFLAMEPEPGVFGPYFTSLPEGVDVLAVSNLGRTAKLVVPRDVSSPTDYVHLKAFLAHAPPPQVQSLWQCVARTARQELSEQPLWISTAGGGVSWLHVRLERSPKYYSYRPYANAA